MLRLLRGQFAGFVPQNIARARHACLNTAYIEITSKAVGTYCFLFLIKFVVSFDVTSVRNCLKQVSGFVRCQHNSNKTIMIKITNCYSSDSLRLKIIHVRVQCVGDSRETSTDETLDQFVDTTVSVADGPGSLLVG